MLQAMRSRAAGWFIKILFLLLIASFAVWGIGDVFRGRSAGNTVAEVGDVKISGPVLDREFRQEVNRLRRFFGGQLDAEQARNMGLLDRSLQSLINGALQDQAARDAGLFVSDDMIRRRIQKEPAFRGADGQFSRELFARALMSSGMNEEAFLATLRRDLARQQLTGAIMMGAQAPSTLVDRLFGYRNEQRVAETLSFPFNAVTNIAAPSEEQLVEYHKNHATRFTAPEYRKLTIVRLTPQDLAKGIEVSDADVRGAYEARRDEFRTPERRKVEQARFDDEAAAKRAAEAARAGRSLADSVKAAGSGEFSALDWVTAGTLPDEIGNPIFALSAPGLAGPISTGLGWHLFAVTEIAASTERTFEQAKGELAEALRLERASDRLFTTGNRMEDAIVGGAKLEDAAAEFGLSTVTVTDIDATGAMRGGGAAPAITGLDQIVAAAFGLAPGAVSPLIELQGGELAVVRVDGVTPPELRPLAQIRDEVVAAWTDDQRKAEARKRAQLALERIAGGTDLATVAREAGVEVARTEPLTRDGRNRGALPQAVVAALFAMKQAGETTSADTQAGVVVARLAEIKPAPQDAPRQQIANEVRQAIANELVADFNNALRQRYTVSVDQRALDALYRN